MCRVLSYLGKPVVLGRLLYEPDNSFIKQSYSPRLMPHLLNLAGFGLMAWDRNSCDPALPFIYKTPNLPFYDQNLRNLTQKILPQCVLAHIRGVSYNEKQVISRENVHPFLFPGINTVLAHNGALARFTEMKYDLLKYIPNEVNKHIQGTTDSEWIYALFVAQLIKVRGNSYTPEILMDALANTLKIIREVRNQHDIHFHSPINLFITNGDFILATRLVFDFGHRENSSTVNDPHGIYHSLWYTYGDSDEFQERKSSIIIASEPLTTNTTSWTEVPESSLILAQRNAAEELQVLIQHLDA